MAVKCYRGQFEASSLGKTVLVIHDTTERPEGIEAGTLKLVGTDENVKLPYIGFQIRLYAITIDCPTFQQSLSIIKV